MMPMNGKTLFPIACLVLILGSWLLAGCVSTNTASSNQYTPTPRSTPTSTIVWFPPTQTPTFNPTPSIQPTIEMRPGLDEVLLTDDFSSESLWGIGILANGTIAYSAGKLTLAVSQPGGYLSSLRSDTEFTDFYLELTANPILCRGEDTYGVLFREIAENSYYRLLLNCNGMLRLERVSYSDILVLQKWQGSSQLAAGAPLTVRIGIWVQGTTLRVFINDSFQVEAKDVRFSNGGIGVFALSRGTTAVTVNFSDLQVRAIQP